MSPLATVFSLSHTHSLSHARTLAWTAARALPSVSRLCSICQCGFDKGEKMKKLPCGHFFHAECADEWLGKYSKSCPICKENIC